MSVRSTMISRFKHHLTSRKIEGVEQDKKEKSVLVKFTGNVALKLSQAEWETCSKFKGAEEFRSSVK